MTFIWFCRAAAQVALPPPLLLLPSLLPIEHSEDSDQTGRIPRLILDFAERKCRFVGFIVRRLRIR